MFRLKQSVFEIQYFTDSGSTWPNLRNLPKLILWISLKNIFVCSHILCSFNIYPVLLEAECDGCGGEGDEGRNVQELLLPQYALATGGLAKDHRPLITFPDHNNFHLLSAPEYKRLLLYLTSVPS